MRFVSILGVVATLASTAVAAPAPSDELAAERKRLDDLLAVDDPSAQAAGLSVLLGEAKDAEVRRFAYRGLAQAYGKLVSAGGAAQPELEARLLDAEVGPQDRIAACYGFASTKPLEALATRCLAVIPTDLAAGAPAAERSRLAGTLALARGDAAEAQRSLAAAALVIGPEQDPQLHARLGDAQRRAGKASAACGTARRLYRAAPLLPAAKELLSTCGDLARTVASLDADRQRELLASDRRAGPRAPLLSLEDGSLRPVDVDLGKTGKVTVLVFFSTWCPHCGVELPRLVRFAHDLAANRRLAAKVDILGVRTAVEREREPYEEFARREGVDFRVLTDPAMSLVFAGYAKAIGRPAALPSISVVDARGVVRFVLEPGDWRDTATELGWAVGAITR